MGFHCHHDGIACVRILSGLSKAFEGPRQRDGRPLHTRRSLARGGTRRERLNLQLYGTVANETLNRAVIYTSYGIR